MVNIPDMPASSSRSSQTTSSPHKFNYGRYRRTLPRILSPIETWGFGLAGHIVWIVAAPPVFQQLGLASMYTWVPLSITAMISCFQVRELALQFPRVTGGVPSYLHRLFPKRNRFTLYAALGWYMGWIGCLALYGIIIVRAIEAVFFATGVGLFYLPLVIVFSLIGFVVGFSSSRALSILHLIFVVPTMFLLLLFSFYGLGWLAFSPDSPGFFPEVWPQFGLRNWLVATFLGTYNIITMETEAVFAADSTNPKKTLNFLPVSAALVPPVFLGGSYVLARLGSTGTDRVIYDILYSANVVLFGEAVVGITLLTVILCCLLGAASGVAIIPRALVQLSRDGLLRKNFSRINSNGIPIPALVLSLILVVPVVFLGGLEIIFYSGGFAYLIAYIVLNFGIWHNRRGIGRKSFPKVSLLIGIFYTVLLVGGGWLSGWVTLLAGLALPLVPIAINALLNKITLPKIPPLLGHLSSSQNFVFNQIVTVICVVAISVSSMFGLLYFASDIERDLLIYAGLVSFIVLSFCSVAVAVWTSLPQQIAVQRTQNRLARLNKKLAKDLRKREELEGQLQQNLRTDHLTSLGNRLSLEETMREFFAQERTEEYALIFIDLDRFKLVNDTLGHDVGDLLLQSAASRLRKIVGQKGRLARNGGDEFIVFLPRSTQKKTLQTAQRIVTAFREPFVVAGSELLTTTSVGVVLGSDRYQDTNTLIRDADVAMYESKSQGRDKYTLFTTEMYRETLRIKETEDILRRALQEPEMIKIEYQPLVLLEERRIVGLEALVRIDSGQEILRPKDFIEISEDSGLIIPLTDYIFEQVCRQQRAWLDRGIKLYVAVNLSNKSIQQPDLVKKIRTNLERFGVGAHYLQLEILETAVMTETSIVRQNLELLSEMGIAIAIDDFGTGYSNLSRLRQLPITTLKVDRSFIVNINQRGLEIIQTITRLAEVLGVKSLVEGVETAEELALIEETRCDYVQGYYFYPPVGPEEVETYLNQLALQQEV